MTESKGPAEHVVDLVVFAPLGFALEARNLLPTFVERGRQQVQMARMIGRFAVNQGQAEGRKRLSRAQEQAETVLAELGLSGHVDPPTSTSTPPPASASASASVASAPRAPVPRTPGPQASAASSGLAISGYDSLAASQVIPRLAGLSAAELEAVRAYEAAHRGRKTILGKIAQLQGG